MRCYAPSSMAFVCAHRSYKMVDVEKCPYIEYKIQGLSGIIAKEEKIFCVKDDLIMQIELIKARRTGNYWTESTIKRR